MFMFVFLVLFNVAPPIFSNESQELKLYWKTYSEKRGDDYFELESAENKGHLFKNEPAPSSRRLRNSDTRVHRRKAYAEHNTDTTITVPRSDESGDEYKAANKKYDYVKILEHLKQNSTNSTNPIPSGPFYNFIEDLCTTILTRMSARKTPGYLELLRKNLKGVGSGFIMKKMMKMLVKNLDVLSQLRGTFGKRFIYKFLEYIMERSPGKDKFFRSMNSIYTVYDANSFDHYINDLRRYGDGVIGITRIKLHTSDVIKKVVIHRYNKLREKAREKIEADFDDFMSEFYERRKAGHFMG